MGRGLSLVWRSDIHLSDDPPHSRVDNWSETLFDKIKQVGEIAKKVSACAVIDGGDLFHLKSPSRNSHELVANTIQSHSDYGCPIYSCVGNHDVKYGSLEYLNESPLGVLFNSGVFRRLYDSYEAWFEKDGISVRIVGIPYHGTEYDLKRFNIKKGTETYLMVVSHCLASPAGGSMFEGEDILSYRDLVGFDADIYAFGHWHKDQGVTSLQGKHFINIGSLSRGSIAQDEVERTPSCAVINLTSGGIKIVKVPLKIKPPGEVFNLDGKIKEAEKILSIESFVETLKDMSTPESFGGSLVDEIRAMELDPEVKEKTLSYLE